MSIYKVNPSDIESFTVVTNPIRYYKSSSIGGVTGSVNVFARRSSFEKEVTPLSSFIDATHNDVDILTKLETIKNTGVNYNVINDYLSSVNKQSISPKKQKVLDIIRFTPSYQFTSNTIRKLIIKDQLSDYYRVKYPSANWAYTNYNSLNFFTSSTVPSAACLLYPNITSSINTVEIHDGYVSGTYTPSGSFSFDFYINPRYKTSFKAGTIFHLSSTYALSLITGSQKDENGYPVGFRILLQLSHSADIPPSLLKENTSIKNRASFAGNSDTLSGYSNSLLSFMSNDNSLLRNNWHHVVVRWGTNLINQGTGSFNIDGIDQGLFVIPSSTIAPRLYGGTKDNPNVLCVGNYYEGLNAGGTTPLVYFFAQKPALRDGLVQMSNENTLDEPTNWKFDHPLNAELHDLSIKRYYMSDQDIQVSSSIGISAIDKKIAFYLPPFFVETSPFRKFVGDKGGILQTPFFEVDGTTNDPFNVAMSFGVGGHYINIENYLKDFANQTFPRTHVLTASAIAGTTNAVSANDFIYRQPPAVKRNLLILPCDDGRFIPDFNLLSFEKNKNFAKNDLGTEDLSLVSLDNLLLTSSLLFQVDYLSSGTLSYTNELIGPSPETPGVSIGTAYQNYIKKINAAISNGSFDPGLQEGAPLTIFQRTRDPSSNQITIFDVSNLYYGKRILPKSLVITDNNFSGSGGVVKITLKDNGVGTLYRSDCLTSSSVWSSVGTVFYDEGLIAIKNPHLYFFGKDGFEISFRGEQNIHVLSINVSAPANQLNSSSNPNFRSIPPSPYPNDPDKEFVYISGINFHDDNLNVIMKTQLAQPIVKRHGDKINFKIKMDF